MTRELDIGSSVLLTDFGMCINYYRLFSPGLYCCTLVPVQLDEETRICPGMIVMANYGRHKQCTADQEAQCFRGPPNFVLDTFPKAGLLDYEVRRACYERAGVVEYVALQDGESLCCLWNRRVDGRFVLIENDDPGMIRSTALPGLWIPTEALKNRDWWSIMASVAHGVTRLPQHEKMETNWRKS
jgi:hypothetical protein